MTMAGREMYSDNGGERYIQWQWWGEICTVTMVGREMYSDSGGERDVQ